MSVLYPQLEYQFLVESIIDSMKKIISSLRLLPPLIQRWLLLNLSLAKGKKEQMHLLLYKQLTSVSLDVDSLSHHSCIYVSGGMQ
jgi:hypothetical protein